MVRMAKNVGIGLEILNKKADRLSFFTLANDYNAWRFLNDDDNKTNINILLHPPYVQTLFIG